MSALFGFPALKSRIRNLVYHAVRDAIRDTPPDTSHNTIGNAIRDASRDAIRHTTPDIIRNIARDVLRETSHDIELQQQLNARASSAAYADLHFAKARPFSDKFELLNYAISLAPTQGLCCEFGVYRGTTANFIADHLGEATLHGFDSFEGLPEHWRGNINAGHFSLDSKLPDVRSNVELHVGWFSDTLPIFIQAHVGPVALLHIDCDLYSSTKCVFDLLKDRIVSGTVIVFDEYFNYPYWQEHEHKAFQEFVGEMDLTYRYLGYNNKAHQVAVQIL